MGVTVDQKTVKMVFDNAQFERGVKDTLNTLGNLRKSIDSTETSSALKAMAAGIDRIGSRFSAMGIVGMTVIQDITNSLIGLAKKAAQFSIGKIINGGWARSSNIEKAKFQLDGLSVAWKDVYDSIDYAVKGTAYGLDEAAKACSSLVASGVQVGDEMSQALRAISGAAAMTNDTYSGMADIFTTVASNGKLMTQQVRQFSSRGLNVAATMAKWMRETGRNANATEAMVSDMVTKGQIDFKTFATYMDETFGEHAKEANRTFEGALSNVGSALSRIGADFWTPLRKNAPTDEDAEPIVNLVTLLNSVRTKIDEIHNAIKPLTEYLAGKALEQIAKLNNFVNGINIGPATKLSLIVKGLIAIFEHLGSVFHKVSEIFGRAWKTVFPHTMSNTIYLIIDKINEFVQTIDVGVKASIGVRKAVMSIANVIGIGIKFFKAFGQAIWKVAAHIFPDLADGAYSITKNLDRWISKLAEFLEKNEIFSKVFDFLADTVIGAYDVLKVASIGIISSILDILGVDTSGINGLGDVLTWLSDTVGRVHLKISEGLGSIAEGFKALAGIDLKNLKLNILEGIAKVLSKLFDGVTSLFSTVIPKLVKGIGEIPKKISEFFGKIDEALKSDDKGLTKTFSEMAFLGMVTNFLKKVSGIINAFQGLSFFGEEGLFLTTFNQLRSTLLSQERAFNANILIKQAVAITVLAFALKLLATVDADRINGTVAAVTELAVVLLSSGAIFSSIVHNSGTAAKTANTVSGFGKAIGAMNYRQILKSVRSLAVSVVILAEAMRILSSLDNGQLARGIIGITASMALLLGAMAILTKMNKANPLGASKRVANQILTLSLALIPVALALRIVGKMKLASIGKSLLGLGVMLAAMAGVLKVLTLGQFNNSGEYLAIAASILIMANALIAISASLFILSLRPFNRIMAALAGMAGILVVFGVVLGVLSSSPFATAGKCIGISASILILSMSLIPVALALTTLSLMPWSKMYYGLIAAGSAMAGLTAILLVLSSINNVAGVIASAGSILIASLAMIPIGLALVTLSAFKWDKISGALKGLLIALGVMTACLLALGGLGSTGLGMAGIAVAAASILLVATAMNVLVPAMLSLSAIKFGKIAGPLAGIGVGLLAVAVGATLAAPGVILLAGGIALIGAAIYITGKGIKAFGEGLAAIAGGLAAISLAWQTGSEAIIEGFKSIISAAIEFIPFLLESIFDGMASVADILRESSPSIIEALSVILNAILQAVIDTAPKLAEAVGVVILAITMAIATYGPNIFNAIAELLVKGIYALSNMALLLVRASLNAIVLTIVKALYELLGDIPGIGDWLGERLKEVEATSEEILDEATAYRTGSNFGNGILSGLIDAINGKSPDAEVAADNAASSIRAKIEPLPEEGGNVGNGLMDNLIGALTGGSEEVNSSGADLSTIFGEGFNSFDFSALGLENKETLLNSLTDYEGYMESGSTDLTGFLAGLTGENPGFQLDAETLEQLTNPEGYNIAGTTNAEAYNASLEGSIGESSEDLALAANKAVSGASAELENQGNAGGKKYSTGLGKSKSAAKKEGKALGASATSGASSGSAGLPLVGINGGNGYVSGLLSTEGSVRAAGKRLAEWAIEEARKRLDEHSPSRVFRQIGAYCPEGFVNGVDSMRGLVINSVGRMATSAIDIMRNAINRIGDDITDEVDINPVIKPVMDLSDVKTGTARLSTMLSANNVARVSGTLLTTSKLASQNQNEGNLTSSVNNYFTQNNYSPKALSRTDIYRQTKNQLSLLKGKVATV